MDVTCLETFLALQGGDYENAGRALGVLDPERFRQWCLRHQIGGLAYLLLEEASLDVSAPRPLLLGLRGTYLEQWARTERLRLTLARVRAILDGAGEPFLVLKGLPFATRYYGACDRRATGDLDIWVRRAAAHRVAEVLESRGLTRRSPRYEEGSPAFDHVHQVEMQLDGIDVELHHALRVHPTFHIGEEALWQERVNARVGDEAYQTLSDEHALMLHLLGLHTDVQIRQTNGRWFVDLYQMLLRLESSFDWDAFFEAREREGTRRISVNSLAVFTVLTRRDEDFPGLSAALAKRRHELALAPDRRAYLDLLRGSSTLQRKLWPLRQYDGGTASAAAWWLSGMPRRIAARPAAFTGDLVTASAPDSPWESERRDRTGSTLTDDFGVSGDTFQHTHLRFGSLLASLHYQRAADLEAVEELFRLRLPSPAPGDDERPGARIYIFGWNSGDLARRRLPSRPVVHHPLERIIEMHEGIVHAWIYERTPLEAYLAVDVDRETRPLLLHALMVVLNKLLALEQRYHLHAAAAGFGGSTSLFLGGKGSGKSTISLAAGRAGATVFSEDHVMLRRHEGRFLVSGCDGNMNLTRKTEEHFFERPIEGLLIESASVAKKQIEMESVVRCRPYHESEVAALFFPRLGDVFAIRSLTPEEAVARILAPLVERHRFADQDDEKRFLDVFVELVESCDSWELSLSRDLSELSRLVSFLADYPNEARRGGAAAR
jgi:hypothetical protein